MSPLISDSYEVAHIGSSATTVIKTGAGRLHTLTINTAASGSITIYDNTSASGTILAVIAASVTAQTFVYDIPFLVGLTIVTAGASDLTISYR